MYHFNLIIFDSVGGQYSGKDIEIRGLGGSEYSVILLAQELVKLDKKVLIFQNRPDLIEDNGVLYAPIADLARFSCESLIVVRYSKSAPIKHRRAFFWHSDLYGSHCLDQYQLLQDKKATLVCLSEFQSNLFPDNINKRVIPYFLPDFVYEMAAKPNFDRKDYLFCSAPSKGLHETLLNWQHLKRSGHLVGEKLKVCCPEYSVTKDFNPQIKELDVKFLGSLTFRGVCEELKKTKSSFVVNTMPETFGLAHLLADVLSCSGVYCLNNNFGALKETHSRNHFLTNKQNEFFDSVINNTADTNTKKILSFRAKEVIPLWEDLLFNKQ